MTESYAKPSEHIVQSNRDKKIIMISWVTGKGEGTQPFKGLKTYA